MVTKQRTSSPVRSSSPLITILATIAVTFALALAADIAGFIHIENLFFSSKTLCAIATPETQDTTSQPKASALLTASGKPVLLCDGNQLPVRDETTGKLSCQTGGALTTSCLWPDGKTYQPWEGLTFYKAVLISDGTSDKTCASMEKVCENGTFTNTKDMNNEFVHRSCQTIDTTKTGMVTCDYEGQAYLPGEVVIKYNQQEAPQGSTCRAALTLCTEQGTRYSHFSGSLAASCTFSRAFEKDFLENNIRVLIEESTWLPKAQALGFAQETQGDSCTTPRWTEIQHGASVISFEDKQVDFTQECVAKTSVCIDGTWNNGIIPYTYESCAITAPKSCDVNGYILPHDSKHTFYKAGKTIAGKYTCEEQARYCFDGKVDGSAEYSYPSCAPAQQQTTIGPASCPSPYGGAAWKHSQQWTAYMQWTINFSQSCEQTAIVCAYGQIRFGTLDSLGAAVSQKLYKTCAPKAAQDCTRQYGTIKHGESITAYKASSATFNEGCQEQTRTCNDGFLDGSYTAKTCTVAQAQSCTNACGTTPHGGKLTTYDAEVIPFGNGETCERNAQISVCENGTFSTTPKSACTCKISDPVGCTAPNGSFIPHMWSLTLYQFDKVQGQAQDGVDQCPRQVRQCINGQFYDYNGKQNPLTYKYSKCEVIPPSAPAQ